ncbi:hypothetical protein GX51_01254 [Blastomyces parvus]|uniref:Major facilitator superfamily (MFS) profile domain-containing protein n=1 Tax=Blastomyces parvus TaxID=2060905 RepID=A0A2B7XIG7_9EURO|nr:hypothetical protein GX51_01254 [Blastomyces parvus]
MALSESDGEVSREPAREYETPGTEKYHGSVDQGDGIGEQDLPRTDDTRGDAKSSRSRSCSREEDGGANLATRQRTNPYSAAVVVPRNERRGLLGRFALLPEVEDPQKYPRKTKWLITLIIAIAAVAAPLGSAIFFPALGEVASSLNTTPTVTNLSVALYMLSMGICPLWWSTFSETFGRRSIYIISFSLFNVFNILSAIATSIEMLIVLRLLSGGAAASVQAIGAGTIADVWESRERGKAMGIFFLGPLCGPLLAPIIGGAMSQAWGWRSTQWFLTIYGGVSLLILVFALPETLVSRKNLVAVVQPNAGLSRTLSRVSSRQVAQNTAKWLKILRMVFVDPLKILLYLRFPAVLLTVLYGSITFGSLYVLNISIQATFSQPPYNFSMLLVGLLYIPHSVGYIISSVLGGRWMDSIMQREAKKANRVDESGMYIYRPEDRMGENAWLGAFIYPAAMLWYGWTAEKHLFWAIPTIANFFFGVGSMIIFSMATTMLTEFMPRRSSSGVALNNFMRNIFSCVGAIVGAPIIRAIGNGWLFTILSLVAFAAGSVIWAMRRFGPRWRLSMEAKVN